MTTPNKDRAAFDEIRDAAWHEDAYYVCRTGDAVDKTYYHAFDRGYQAACADRDKVIAELVAVMERGIEEVSRSGLTALIADYTNAITKAKESSR